MLENICVGSRQHIDRVNYVAVVARMDDYSTASTTPVIQQRVRLRFRDRSEVSLAIKYLIFAFNILIWVRFIICYPLLCCVVLYFLILMPRLRQN